MGVVPLFICIRKRTLALPALFCCFMAGLAAVLWFGCRSNPVPAFAVREDLPVIVVVDPGHGGEDGGAVSPEGVEEARLNLEIALRVRDLLCFSGQRTIMTRTEDVSIHTEGDTIRARKASDIRNRVSLVNGTENAVLLSIHQNSLPSSPVTHGAQVFWNGQEGAEALAGLIQDTLNCRINQGNEKLPKPVPGAVYLMKHISAPGVIVECGFLSNGPETARLQERDYQMRLAAAVAAGYLRCLSGEAADKAF